MKNHSPAKRSRCVLLAGVLALSLTGSALGGNTWTGGGASGNWSDSSNWGGAQPGYGTLTFSGSTRTTNADDNITAMNELLWTGSSAWTLNQGGSTVLSLFDNGGLQCKIENQSTGLVTINLPITLASNNGSPPNPFAEINAVNGDITFGTGTLTVNGSSVNGVKLFGGASRTVTFNDTVSATGKWFGFTSGNAQNVVVGSTGNMTTGDFYVMNGGTLTINNGGSLTTSALRLGGDFGNTGNQNQTLGGTFQLGSATGGQTFGSTINSVTGNTSGALLVNSQNTSGTNTISGGIFLDSQLRIGEALGGTLSLTGGIDVKAQLLLFQGGGNINVTNVIQSSTGNSAGSSVQIGANGNGNTGNPTVTLSNANTYNGDTLVRAGTLQFASGGTIDNSTIRLGSISGPATNASVNLINSSGGQTINSVFNPVAGNTGFLSINSQNTSGTNTLSNHIGMDNNLMINQSFGGTLNITQARSGTTTNTGIDLKGNTLTFTPAGLSTINDSGSLYNSTGNGNVVMDGTGNLTFSGASANTYTGTTTVNSGELDLNKTGVTAMGGNLVISGGTVKWLQSNQMATSGSVTINSGTLQLNGQSQTVMDLKNLGGNFSTGINGSWTGTSNSMTWGASSITNLVNTGGSITDIHLTVAGGTDTIQAGGAVNIMPAGTGLEMDGGTITINSDATTPGTISLTSNVGADDGTTSAINSGGSAALAGNINLNGAVRTFTIGSTNAATSLTVGASIQGAGGGLTKAGPGTLTLAGANTYTGATLVSAGTLNAAANSALGSTSGITVNSGGSLLLSNSSATDRIGNGIGVALNGGTFGRSGPGNITEGTGAHTANGGGSSTGTNAVGMGALTLQSNSTLDFGTGGVATFVFSSFAPNAHVLNILNWTSSAVAPNVSGTDGSDDRLIFNQDQSANLADFSFGGVSATEIALGGGYFEIVAVPEPGTWAISSLIGLALVMGGGLRRRRCA